MGVLGERLGSEGHFEEGGSRCWVGVIVKGMNQEFGAVELCEELENSKDGGPQGSVIILIGKISHFVEERVEELIIDEGKILRIGLIKSLVFSFNLQRKPAPLIPFVNCQVIHRMPFQRIEQHHHLMFSPCQLLGELALVLI
jgi:hypothetical protein